MPEAPETTTEVLTPDVPNDGFNTMRDTLQKLMGEVNDGPVVPDTKPLPEAKIEIKPDPSTVKVAEPEKKEAPKVEDKPADKPDESTEGMSKSAGEKFNSIKKARDEFKAKADQAAAREKELQAEIARLKSATPQVDPDIERIKTEHKELSETLQRVKLAEHPRFKAYFENKTNAAIETAKRAVGEHAETVASLLKQPDSAHRREQLEAVMQGLSLLQQNQIAAAVTRLDEVNAERDGELARAGENTEQITKAEKAEADAKAAKQKASGEAALKSVLEAAKTMEAFKPREGDDEHNSAISAREEFIRAAFTGTLTPQQVYSLPLLAAEATFLKEKELPALREKVTKLESELAARSAAKPSVGESGKGKTETASSGTVDFISAYKNAWNG